MASVMQYQRPVSPLEGIANALKIVESVYGIKGAAAAADKISEMKDPNSNISKLSRQEALSALPKLASLGTISQDDVPKLTSMLNSVSAWDLQNSMGEQSPLLKLATGQLAANAQAARTAGIVGTKQEANEMTSNKEYASELRPQETSILSGNKVLGIIEKVKAGQRDPDNPNNIVMGPQLKSDLSNTLASMFANGKITVSGAEHQNFDSAYSRFQNLRGFLGGTTENSIPSDQLNQLENDVKGAKDELANNHEIMFNSFLEGAPDRLKPKLQSRYDTFRKQAGLDQDDDDDSTPPAQKQSGRPSSGSVAGIPHEDIAAEIARRAAAKAGVKSAQPGGQ